MVCQFSFLFGTLESENESHFYQKKYIVSLLSPLKDCPMERICTRPGCCIVDTEYGCPVCKFAYCSRACQKADWPDHQLLCSASIESAFIEEPYPRETEYDNEDEDDVELVGIVLPNQPPARDTSFRTRGFYTESIKLMKRYLATDMFTWMCFQSFKTSPVINAMLFKVNGDLTKLDDKFGDVIKTKARVAAASKGGNQYSIFNTFFATCLQEAYAVGRPLLDPRTHAPIFDERTLVQAYPQIAPMLRMRNSAFTRLYVMTINNAINSIPKLVKPVKGWRGYSPLNLPNTLTLDTSHLKVGQEITNWAFMSVSLDSRVSTLFLNLTKRCCMLRVTIPAGFPVFMISSDSSDFNYPQDLSPWRQMEILLPVGCVFRVTRLGKNPRSFDTNNPGERTMSGVVEVTLVRVARLKKK